VVVVGTHACCRRRGLSAADVTTLLRSAVTLLQGVFIGVCEVAEASLVAPLADGLGGAALGWLDTDASGTVSLAELRAWMGHLDALGGGGGGQQ
jgi:hypothetical protein